MSSPIRWKRVDSESGNVSSHCGNYLIENWGRGSRPEYILFYTSRVSRGISTGVMVTSGHRFQSTWTPTLKAAKARAEDHRNGKKSIGEHNLDAQEGGRCQARELDEDRAAIERVNAMIDTGRVAVDGVALHYGQLLLVESPTFETEEDK